MQSEAQSLMRSGLRALSRRGSPIYTPIECRFLLTVLFGVRQTFARMTYRPPVSHFCKLLLVAYMLAGCVVTRTLAPSEVRHAGRPKTFQVFLNNGSRTTVSQATIARDSVTGIGFRDERVAIPLADIHSLQVREVDRGLTVVLIAAGAATIIGLSYVIMLAGYSGT